MATELFNKKTIERLCSNISILPKQKKASKEWLDLLESEELNDEKKNYFKFAEIILKELLGYDIKKDLVYEEGNVEFPFKDSKGNFVIAFEAKGYSTKDLFSIQSGRKKEHETPIKQTWDYMGGKLNLPYGVATNYRHFVLLDRGKGYFKYHLFDFLEIKNDSEKLKEFIAIFSKESIENNFLEKLYKESVIEEREFTSEFYKLFHETRLMLIKEFQDNGALKGEAIYFAQLFLNRLIFVFFAEDTGKLERRIFENNIKEFLKHVSLLSEDTTMVSDNIINLFKKLNTGSDKPNKIFGFNGGLFKEEIPRTIYFKDLKKKNYFKSLEKYSKLKKKPKLTEDIIKIIESYKDRINPIIKNLLIMASYDFNTEVNVNILGHIFEQSLNDIEELKEEQISKRKKEGIYYTPEYITDYICRNTIIPYLSENNVSNVDDLIKEYFDNINELEKKFKEIKILDPACGSGAFLVKAVEILIEIHKRIQEVKQAKGVYTKVAGKGKKKVDSIIGLTKWIEEDEAREIIENNIFGVDINEESVEITKLSLFFKIAKKNKKLIDLSKNIKCGNSLIDDPNIAGNKAFKWQEEFKDIFDKGGFDIVIGNPPYTYRKAISEQDKEYFKEKYISTEGNFDLYKFFVEKTSSLVASKGYVSLIIPNTFLTAKTYVKFRKFVLDSYSVLELFDLGQGIFENVVVENIIFLFKKEKNKKIKTRIKIQRNRKRSFHEIEDDYLISLDNSEDNREFTFNIYLSPKIKPIIEKIRIDSQPIKKIAYCTVGINTGYIKSELVANCKKDQRYHKMITGKDIGRNKLCWNNEWIMYDPGIVKSFGSKGRTLPPEYVFTEPKILVQRTRRGMKRKLICYYDEEKYYNLNRLSNIVLTNKNYYLKYIYSLLNSSLLDYYFNVVFNEYEVKPTHLSELPIKQIEKSKQKEFVGGADQILELNKELENKEKKFLNRVKENFHLESISKKIMSFHELNFLEFIEELKKYKIKLSLKEQEEWEEYFNKRKEEILLLKEKIDNLDKEIDELVYKLYGITELEKKIIEESLNK